VKFDNSFFLSVFCLGVDDCAWPLQPR
jgi:hypothetical protein